MSEINRGQVSLQVVSGVIRSTDILINLTCALVAYWVYASDSIEIPFQYGVVIGVGLLVQAQFFQLAALYRDEKLGALDYQVVRLVAAWTLTAFALVTLAFLTKVSNEYSRGWALIWFTLTIAALIASRILLHIRMRHWMASGQLRHNIAIFGAGEQGVRLVKYLNSGRTGNFHIVGIFDDRSDRVPEIVEGHDRKGTLKDLLRLARNERVDQILVALPWTAEERIMEIFRELRVLPVDIKLSSDLVGYNLTQASFDSIGSVPVMQVAHKPLSDWKLLYKDLEDRILGALILLFIAPVMLAIAVLIKLDSPGPILFKQKRYGFNNKVIEVFKFRTMRQEACQSEAVPQATRNDSRVTVVGRFLRRSSLDELPQLLNVMRGEMSLVGPRPHAVPHNEYFTAIISEYASRHRVKPGITGWAQINGWRGETDTLDKMQKRIEHDVYYIDNWSVKFDLFILIMTVLVIFRGDNAY